MNAAVVALTAVFALSGGLLAWFLMDAGTLAMSRYRDQFTRRSEIHLRDMFMFIDPTRLFILNLCAMATGGTLAWALTGSALSGVATFAALGLAPRFAYCLLRTWRLRRFEGQLPDALMMMAGSLRAGLSLNSAFQQVAAEMPAPLSQEFELMLREQRLGVGLEDALAHLARRVPCQNMMLMISAMRIATESGGGLAETLERTAATVRSQFQVEGKIRALTAQGKLQAWIVCLLPIVLMAVLNRMDPEAMAPLWSTRIGWATLALLALLEGLGMWMIRRIVAIDV